MRYFILCDNCVGNLTEDVEAYLLAKSGPQGADENDICVLSCPYWEEHHALEGSKFFCDECGEAVAVHHTSSWFVETHKGEREA